MGLAFLEKVGNTSTSGGGTGSGDGLEIQGILKEYYVYAGDNITPGSFVEFVQGVGHKEIYEGTEIDTAPVGIATEEFYGPNENGCDYITPVLLEDEKRIFFSFVDGAGQTAGRVLKFENGVITYGEKYIICSNGRYTLKSAVLSGDRVFSFKAYSDYYYLLQINDMEISQMSRGEVSGNTGVSDEVTVLKIDDSHVFVTYNFSYSSSTNMSWAAKVVTIAEDGTMTETATPGTMTNGGSYPHFSFYLGNNLIVQFMLGYGTLTTWNIATADTKIERPSANVGGIIPKSYYGDICKLDDTHFFCLYNEDSENLCGKIITFDNNNFTAGDEFIICPSIGEYSLSSCKTIPGTTNVLVFYVPVDADYAPTGIVGVILDCKNNVINSILSTTNLDITTNISNWWGERLQIVFLENNGSNNFMLFFGGTLQNEDEENVDNCPVAQCMYVNPDTNEIVTAYSTTTVDITWETQAKSVTTAPFYGVAKTGGQGGTEIDHKDKIQVYTL